MPQPRLFLSQAQDANLRLFYLHTVTQEASTLNFCPFPEQCRAGKNLQGLPILQTQLCCPRTEWLSVQNASLLALCAPPSRTGRTASSATTVPACTAKAPPTLFYALDFAFMQISARTCNLCGTPLSCSLHELRSSALAHD